MSDERYDDVVDEELTGLVRGELAREELAAVIERLRASEDARRELVDTVAAHAALTAAARTLRGVSRPAPARTEADPSRTPVAVRSVVLQPVSEAAASGEVTMAEESAPRTRMQIITSGLAPAGPGRFYYAWLFDSQTNKMLPLGLVSAGTANRFEVADDIVARYHAIDISLQDDNGDPRHSATSVLRASF